MRPWYSIKNLAGEPTAEVLLFDFIGDFLDEYMGGGPGVVTAKQFAEDLSALPAEVRNIKVRINSPGGDVTAAMAINNLLRDQQAKGRTVQVLVDGMAASAATLVMVAGAPVQVADNAIIMVHNPWSMAMGNADEMRKAADTLDTFRDTIVATYRQKSKLAHKELIALMDAETWMTADEAVANGFADEVVQGAQANASLDPRVFATLGLKVPEQFKARVDALLAPRETPGAPLAEDPVACVTPEPPPAPVPPPPETPLPIAEVEDAPEALAVLPQVQAQASAEQVLALCAGAGLDVAFTAALVGIKPTEAQAAHAVQVERDKRAAEALRCSTITALGERYNQPKLAARLVAAGVGVDEAKAVVAEVTAQVDAAVVVNAGLGPDGGAPRRAAPAIDVQAIYRLRNQQH